MKRITSNLKQFDPSSVAFIQELVWNESGVFLKVYCQSRKSNATWPDLKNEFEIVHLQFIQVSSLNFISNSMGLHQITGFDIIDLSSDQLESINYKVVDYENGSLEFSCKEIEYEKTGLKISL